MAAEVGVSAYGDNVYSADSHMKSMASQVSQKIDHWKIPPAYKVGTASGASDLVPASRFPSRLVTGDARDNRYNIRQNFVGQNGVVPGVGMATVGDEYFSYLEDKSKMEIFGDFKQWLMGNMDLSSPEKFEYWKNKFPEVFKDKEELAKRQQELHTRLLSINLRGPQDMDDWFVLYAIYRGYIEVPKAPIFDPESVPQMRPDAQGFTRGLFNLKRFFPRTGLDGSTYIADVNPTWANPVPQNILFQRNEGAFGLSTGPQKFLNRIKKERFGQ